MQNKINVKYHGAPGTGKTTKLLERVMELFRQNNNVNEYLICTYSKPQADDLKYRLLENGFFASEKEMNEGGSLIGTIHSICLKLLKRNNLIGDKQVLGASNKFGKNSLFKLKKFFSENGVEFNVGKNKKGGIDDSDERVIDDVLEEKSKGELFLDFYAFERECHQNPFLKFNDPLIISKLNDGEYVFLKKAFEEWKVKENLIDFTDMLVLVHKNKLSPSGLFLIAVDEYQDVNLIQSEIISCWREANSNAHFIALGDIFQSIYVFRGCNPSFFNSLDSQLEILGETHRLNKDVWDNARLFISKFDYQNLLGKVKALKDGVQSIYVLEENSVAFKDKLETLLFSLQNNPSEKTFLLFRTNKQLASFKEFVVEKIFPFDFNYLKYNVGSLKSSPRYELFNGVNKLSRDERISVSECLALVNRLPSSRNGAFGLIHGFKNRFKQEMSQNKTYCFDDLFPRNLSLFGEPRKQLLWDSMKLVLLSRWYGSRRSSSDFDVVEAEERFNDFKLNVDKYGDKRLEDFKVKLCLGTIHSSKGLEAENVILSDGITNKIRKSLDSQDGREQEARVWYVGMTRCIDKLYVLHGSRNYFNLINVKSAQII